MVSARGSSLAVALLGEPDLLVLDEPTVGLDPVLRRDLWALFHRLADQGTAVFVSSHVMDEAERCDRLLLMREGRILADDSPAELLVAHRCRRHRERLPGPRREGGRAMSPRILGAVAARVLNQLRHDHRTLALLLVVPMALMTLLWWMFKDAGTVFDEFGPALLAMFPFIIMFLVTSVTTLRERSSGTLERLLAMPTGKVDFLGGYALAFGAVAAVQSALTVGLCVWVLDLNLVGPAWMLTVVAVADALLGTALGLFVSAFARTEFQAVQFMPALVIPQILLCGLFVPRDAAAARARGDLRRAPAVLRRGRDERRRHRDLRRLRGRRPGRVDRPRRSSPRSSSVSWFWAPRHCAAVRRSLSRGRSATRQERRSQEDMSVTAAVADARAQREDQEPGHRDAGVEWDRQPLRAR